jgi:hypothetical protein
MGGYLCVLLLVTFFLSAHTTAHDLPDLKVTAGPQMAFGPADVTITVFAKPHDQNRYLALGMGSANSAYARSSQKSLDGENEPGQLANVLYRDVPAGDYLIVATLYTREGKIRAQKEATIKRLPRH